MHLAIWIITLLLVGLWTLVAWGLSQLLAIDGRWIEQVQPWLAQAPFGGWMEGWFPDWLQVAKLVLDAAQAGLAWLGGAAPVLVWVVWGGGALLLLLLAGALSLLVALIKRSTPPASPPPVAAA